MRFLCRLALRKALVAGGWAEFCTAMNAAVQEIVEVFKPMAEAWAALFNTLISLQLPKPAAGLAHGKLLALEDGSHNGSNAQNTGDDAAVESASAEEDPRGVGRATR